MNKDFNEKRETESQDFNEFLPLVLAAVPIAGGYGVYKYGKYKGAKEERESSGTTCPKQSPIPFVIAGLLVGALSVLTVKVNFLGPFNL
jgi:hypothetical protein